MRALPGVLGYPLLGLTSLCNQSFGHLDEAGSELSILRCSLEFLPANKDWRIQNNPAEHSTRQPTPLLELS